MTVTPSGPAQEGPPDPAPPAVHPADRPFVLLGSALAVAATAVIGGVLVYGVVMRYVFNDSSDFTTELPTYLFPWLVAGGVIAAMGRQGHLAIDFFTRRAVPERRVRIELFVWVLSALVNLTVLVLSLRLVLPLTQQLSPVLGWPLIGSFAAFQMSVGVLAAQCLIRAWVTLRQDGEASSP